MKVTKLHPLVWIFHKALDNPESIINFYENNYEWDDWYTFGKTVDINIRSFSFDYFPSKFKFTQAYNKEEFWYLNNPEERNYLSSITETFYTVTKQFWDGNNFNIDKLNFFPFNIAKYIANPSARMNFHTDYKNEQSDPFIANKHTTAVFYLNDDYIGGEICFIELDNNQEIIWYDEYKPQAGDVVVFSSQEPIYHGVKTVEQGSKYILRTYWEQWEPATDEWNKGVETYGELLWREKQQKKQEKIKSQFIWRKFKGVEFGIQYINTDPTKPYTYWKKIGSESKTVNIYKDQVYEILDFITFQEQEALLHIVKQSRHEDWPTSIDNEFQKNDPDISGKVLPLENKLIDIREKLNIKIQTLFPKATRINSIAAIQRYKPNTNMGVHTDNGLDPTVQYGLVVYLNDDYEGGEIHYPDLDITIKPKARSIIIHPAGLPHEVLKIKGNNTRYILSSFVRGEEKIEVFYGE